MADAAAAAPAVQAKKKATKTKKPKKEMSHPPVSSMVNAAIKNLKDRKGSSLAAIKKYIAANYKCDVAKLAPFIRRYLKKAVADGKLKQVKGSGAAGSFRMGDKTEKPKAKKAKKPKKEKKAKAPKKPKAKTPKKPKAKKAKTPKKPKAAKSPKKAKKPAKAKEAAKKPAKKAAKK